MSILSDIINCGETWAEDRAKYAVEIQEAVKSGQMSADEGKEILRDLEETTRLEEQSANSQVRAALLEAIITAAKAMA
mgnify:CR=1 FL=1